MSLLLYDYATIMNIGSLIALCLTALFLSVILPGLIAHADRRPQPPGPQR